MSDAALAATRPRLIVRRAWWAYLPLLSILALGAAFWAALAWHAAEMPLVRFALVLLCALTFGLLLLVANRTVRLLAASNWLLRVVDGAVILNPIDASLRRGGEPLEVPFGEIVSARRVVEKRIAVGDHSIEDVHDTHVYLELALADVDSSPLVAFRPPITLQSARTLRIGWRDSATRLTPSVDAFIVALPPTVIREPDVRVDWQDSRTLSDDELRERVRALCAGNDRLAAIKIVRVRYGMNLRQAKDLVEQLSTP